MSKRYRRRGGKYGRLARSIENIYVLLLLPRGAIDKIVHSTKLLEDAEVGQEDPVQRHLQKNVVPTVEPGSCGIEWISIRALTSQARP